ncbi:hypothetical protein WDU94_009894 [Cyamophila willieti]
MTTNKDLPLLPGYTFDYQNTLPSVVNTKKKFAFKKQFFMKNGHVFETSHSLYPTNKIRYEENKGFVPYELSLTYPAHKVNTQFTTQFLPHFVIYGGKKLSFGGYFIQNVAGSPYETYRIRVINLLYFLEDDTLCINEGHRPDSGFKQVSTCVLFGTKATLPPCMFGGGNRKHVIQVMLDFPGPT